MMGSSSRSTPGRHGIRRGFTLTELLVVMGVITVLATLTVIGIRSVARNARMASATNALMVALDTARALAMKENAIVLVVFRPRLSADRRKQGVEIVIARWTGEAATANVSGASFVRQVVDRFVPVPGIAFRELPVGIKIAGPRYGEDLDEYWVTQTHLPVLDPVTGSGEVAGQLIAVMYAPDGSTITRNSRTDSVRTFVDFNNNGCQDFGNDGDNLCDGDDVDYNTLLPPLIALGDFTETFFDQRFEGEETYVVIVPFVAVYDDEKARELRTTDWTDQTDYEAELTGSLTDNPTAYINLRANRIHFNRYTGVAMK